LVHLIDENVWKLLEGASTGPEEFGGVESLPCCGGADL
jgi:hypothetical protein